MQNDFLIKIIWRDDHLTQHLFKAYFSVPSRHCPHNMQSRVYATVRRPSVCLSVCLFVLSFARCMLLLQVFCWAPDGQEISIDCCPALSSSGSAAQCSAANADSATFTAAAGSWTQTFEINDEASSLVIAGWWCSMRTRWRGQEATDAGCRLRRPTTVKALCTLPVFSHQTKALISAPVQTTTVSPPTKLCLTSAVSCRFVAL